MERTLIYCRVSSPDQAKEEKTSLPDQEKRCRDWLDKLGGFDVVVVEYEEGVSGAKFNRPSMDRVLGYAERGEIDVVCLAKVDRLARGRLVDSWLELSLKEYGVEIMYVDRDTSTPQGKMLVNVEKDFAEYEHQVIKERLTRGRKNAILKGRLIGPGRPAYGYNYTKSSDQLEILEYEAIWVRWMFEWIGKERWSLMRVAQELNNRQVPTKRNGVDGSWYATTVSQIIHNPLYYGQHTYNRRKAVAPNSKGKKRFFDDIGKTSSVKRDPSEWLSVPAPAIIDKELWDQAQAAIKFNEVFSPRNQKLVYLLRSRMICSECGYTWYGSMSHKKRVYMCGGKRRDSRIKRGGSCWVKLRHADDVEGKVWTKIIAKLQSLSSYDELSEGESDEAQRQYQHDKDMLLSLVARENELKQEEDRLVNLYMKGKLSDDLYDQKKAEIDQQRISLDTLRAEVEERMKDDKEIKADALALQTLANSVELLNNPTDEQKSQVIDTLKIKVTANPDGSVDVDGLISDSVLDLITTFVLVAKPQAEAHNCPKPKYVARIVEDDGNEQWYADEWSEDWGDAEIIWTPEQQAQYEEKRQPIAKAMAVLRNNAELRDQPRSRQASGVAGSISSAQAGWSFCRIRYNTERRRTGGYTAKHGSLDRLYSGCAP